MRATELRQLLREAELTELAPRLRGGDTVGLFFRIARSFAPYESRFRRTPEALEILALRASAIASAMVRYAVHERDGGDFFRAEACSNDWRDRAAAQAEIAKRVALDPIVVGSLAADANGESRGEPTAEWLDGSIACRALAVAANEASPPALDAMREYREAASLSRHDPGAIARAQAALRRLAPVFVANALDCGFSRADARAASLTAFERLAGLATHDAQNVYVLGAAAFSAQTETEKREECAGASSTFSSARWDARRGPSAVREHDSSAERLIARLRVLNDWRARTVADGNALGAIRLFGAAAIGAAYGFSWQWRRRPATSAFRRPITASAHENGRLFIDGLPAHSLPEAWLERLAPLALDAALERLRGAGEAVRTPDSERRRFRRLTEALASDLPGKDPAHHAFGAWIGRHDFRTRTADVRSGQRLWWAAPGGRWKAVCRSAGARGREIVCRALADDDGRLVGYAGFDALSREFAGEPRLAFYGLDGRRAGTLDPCAGGGCARLKEPALGFFTAPETIALAA